MAMLLKDMIVGLTDNVQQQIVDLFIRSSELLELMPFDDAISPTGGSTMTYGYVQTLLPSTTGFRELNTEYTPTEATTQKRSVDLKIFGGAFAMDRVLKQAEGKYNNEAFQFEQKIRAAVGTFHSAMLMGDEAAGDGTFDGLDKMLVGQPNEFGTESAIDLSTIAQIKTNADEFYEALLRLINRSGAHALLVNESMKTKIQTVARVLGFKTESEEAFGRVVTSIGENKVRMIDLKNTYPVNGTTATETPIIGINERTVGGAAMTGLTDIYAVRFDVLEGFHGVTLTGTNGITAYRPNFNEPGAVKKGEVEMVAAVALKNTRSAGVLRNVKII